MRAQLTSITSIAASTPQADSAERVLTRAQGAVLITVLASVAAGLVIAPATAAFMVVAAATMLFFVVFAVRALISAQGLAAPSEAHGLRAKRIADADLPRYSILLPLFREAEILPRLIRTIRGIDYPLQKLQVLLLIEGDDRATLACAKEMQLPPQFEIVPIEASLPRTKPKACNVGLARVTSPYCVIYDAEDRPEPDQLRKAVATFAAVHESVVCLQARLQHWNAMTNLLTRFFAAEYAAFFDIALPGLARLRMPIPLGGTSNHFATSALRQLGGWDSYNVTEDIDIGMRIARSGQRAEILDSVTWEEANSAVGNWIRQRSRWIKGHIQTYFVHMRSPRQLATDLGMKNFVAFQIIVGATPLVLLISPVFWVVMALWMVTKASSIQALYPAPILYLATLTLFFGNLTFVYYAMTGCIARGQYSSVKLMALCPLYWALMSVAAWKGVAQLVYRPHYWEKTDHGLVMEADVTGELPSSLSASGSSA